MKTRFMPLFVAFVLFVLSRPFPATAFDAPFTVLHQVTNNLSASGPTLTPMSDIDQDGDLDFWVTATNLAGLAMTHWMENFFGSGNVWQQHAITNSVGEVPVLAADFDRDGRDEVITREALAWDMYLYDSADGGTNWTRVVVVNTLPINTRPAYFAAADIDQDGDMDIVISIEMLAGSPTSATRWFENANGLGTAWNLHDIGGNTDLGSAVTPADMDRDGDLDVVSWRETPNAYVWWENAGALSNWTDHTICTTGFETVRASEVGDFDSDGDPDVVTMNDDLRWWENVDGTATNWALHTIDAGEYDGAIASDLDEDGDLDIVLAYNGIGWFENVGGTGTNWVDQTFAAASGSLVGQVVVDMDRDGDVDVLGSDDINRRYSWLENTRDAYTRRIGSTNTIDAVNNSVFDVDTADFDRDGDADVAAVNVSGELTWHANNALASSWTENAITNSGGDLEAVEAADINRDGEMDLVTAHYSEGKVSWWRNDGDGSNWTHRNIASGLVFAPDACVGDFDGDGDPDVASMAEADNVYWFERVGTTTNWTTNLVTDFTNGTSLAAVDLDSDGDMDLLATSAQRDRVSWFENDDGVGGAWTGTRISTNFANARDAIAADVDRDGDVDVIGASWGPDGIHWWEATGNVSAIGGWDEHTLSASFTGAYRLAVGDYDRDGDVDVLAASRDRDRVSVFNNIAGGTAWTESQLINGFSQATAVAAADLDRDGDLDFIGGAFESDRIAWVGQLGLCDPRITKSGPAQTNAVSGFQYTLFVTNAGPYEATAVTVTDALPSGVAWVSDTAGAGPPSGGILTWDVSTLPIYGTTSCVVTVSYTSTVFDVYLTNIASVSSASLDTDASNNTGSVVTFVSSIPNIFTGLLGAASIRLADFNKDGEPDIVVAASDLDDVIFWRNLGAATNWHKTNIISTLTSVSSVDAGDFNGDGYLDVVAGAPDINTVVWWPHIAGSNKFGLSPEFASSLATGVASVCATDLDLDGDTDIALALETADRIGWLENTSGTGSTWNSRNVQGNFGGARDVRAADMDRDGDIDLVGAANAAGDVSWFENLDSAGTSWTEHAIDTSFLGASAVFPADIDGDGDPDVAGVRQAGDELAWWENVDGTASNWTKRLVDASLNGARDVVAADWDRDGDLDLVIAARGADRVAWYENINRRGTVWDNHSLQSSFDGAESVDVADLNSDGSLDAAGVASLAGLLKAWMGENAPQPGTFTLGYILATNVEPIKAVDLGDIDRDGDTDIVAGSALSTNVAWWENLDRAGSSWAKHTIDAGFTNVASLVVADLDRDGAPDVVAPGGFALSGKLVWWRNVDGTGLSWTLYTIASIPDVSSPDPVAVADIDGDGDPDVLASSDSATDGIEVTWWENTDGSATNWTMHIVDTNFGGASGLVGIDIDCDGDMDIAACGKDNDELRWWANLDGSGLSWSNRLISSSLFTPESLAVSDFDDDGDPDLLTAESGFVGPIFYVNPRDPDDFWSVTAAGGLTYSGFADAAPGDFNGDGWMDAAAVSFSVGGTNSVSRHEQSRTTNGVIQFIGSNVHQFAKVHGSYVVRAGDMDGDADQDLVIGSQLNLTTNFVLSWYENIHSPRVRIDKGASSTATQVTYTVTVSNGLSVQATDVRVDDYFPAGVTWQVDSCGVGAPTNDVWSWTVGTLNAGASATCTVRVNVASNAADTLVNHARVFATAAGQAGTNDFDTAATVASDGDSDNDGMPDAYETQHGFNPFDAADALIDSDGDKVLNLYEYIADTIPTNASSFFEAQAVSVTSTATVVFSGSLSRVYTLQFSTNLLGPSWSNVTGSVDQPGGGAGDSLSDTNVTAGKSYRLQVEIP
jgi:uncharacterized repeat protein (TIGR01451 family)